ncbi:hypothetical protein P168DRAFT_290181 [Aspergillus campestris IBT 28561]|uniref:Uncharacterized protein n=1 Tax=Aspergillus campestris (strain IBT 28561) TaxID=1392248 RepID=A0A2I1D2F3_ASPC2|nr:uncharacterized protein P168DRAFT_290181 [Aspergillus campestris IBT 28561]PKY04051.1 hypothetical protein P168DRAFT_290181 [Aspergillus campestris IBT 28561]
MRQNQVLELQLLLTTYLMPSIASFIFNYQVLSSRLGCEIRMTLPAVCATRHPPR